MEFVWAALNITDFTEHSFLYVYASPLSYFLLKMFSGFNEVTASRNTGSLRGHKINLSIRSTFIPFAFLEFSLHSNLTSPRLHHSSILKEGEEFIQARHATPRPPPASPHTHTHAFHHGCHYYKFICDNN